ncbi:MAG: tetratricopeptide repeat protein [Flavobacteriales bacterium]|nr:tetratricopeptide repeat protein [Flavobacteriales bacterium]
MSNRNNIIAGVVFFLTIFCITYSNHFTNGFEFDDTHTIVNNQYIRNINNVPLFFTDIKYYGTNPGNQGYNPMLVTLNAIDYWWAGELNPVYFHVSIFLWYMVQLVVMYFLFLNIFRLIEKKNQNRWISLLLVAFYALHTANAETINYIIMRSDSFSALCIVVALFMWQIQITRKYYLYLLPMVIGILTKEVGVMFSPILLMYILLFEEQVSLKDFFLFKKNKETLRALIKSAPALLLSFGIFIATRKFFMPENISLLSSGNVATPWQYFYTQWVVIAHYLGNFILPLDLSADPDFEIFPAILNRKVLLSLIILLAMVIIAFWASAQKKNYPIAFGILWFFISLAPTSSFIPFGQIANDHRTFLPYIGLVLSAGWGAYRLVTHFKLLEIKKWKYIISMSYIFTIAFHSYGTYQRNIMWGSSEKLWKDVTEKSPRNGRGWMNYGLIHMQNGRYDEALACFTKTLEFMPYWAYIHINMGILKNAMGNQYEAETYFLSAIKYQPEVPEGYYYYANFLLNQNRFSEAFSYVQKGLEISPGHSNLNQLYSTLKNAVQNPQQQLSYYEDLCKREPSATNFIELSVLYYQNNMFEKCIEAGKNAIKIDSTNAIAYNNICSAYNAMQQYEKAIEACNAALRIDPTFERAKNNLALALNQNKQGKK